MAKKILLIDDEELVVKSLARYLKTQGYAVETARNGEEAIKKAQESLFDLVVVDIRIPGINGIEIIQRLRKIFQGKYKAKVPEIVITGFASDDMHQEAENLGIVDYIYKPFDTSAFIEAVKRNLGDM